MINIKAIGISAALTTTVASGLVSANQNFTIAGRDNSKLGEQVNKEVSTSNIQLLAQNSRNDKGNKGKGNDNKSKGKKIPTPALLPGLIALGAGVLRARKAEAAKVDD